MPARSTSFQLSQLAQHDAARERRTYCSRADIHGILGLPRTGAAVRDPSDDVDDFGAGGVLVSRDGHALPWPLAVLPPHERALRSVHSAAALCRRRDGDDAIAR